MPRKVVLAVAASAAMLSTGPAMAEAEKPTAAEVLFDHPHISNLAPGTELKYRFERTVSDPKLVGEPFSDDINLKVTKNDGAGKRDIAVQIFTGERARDPESITEMTGNPLLVFYLDRAVRNFAFLAGGHPSYLKQQFRSALGSNPQIEPTKVTFAGKEVDGYRITVTPYAKDRSAARMQGYQDSRFVIVTSTAVPGEFVDFIATFQSTVEGAPRIEERITLVSAGEGK